MKKASFFKNILLIDSYLNDPIKIKTFPKTINHELQYQFVLINNFK